MAWVGGMSSHGGLERCLRWGFSGGWGGGQKGWLGRGVEGMRGEGAEALEEAGDRRGDAGGGCSRWGALPRAGGRGSPERVPRGDGGRYLKLGGEARCSPRKGEEAGGDAAPFSRSAILWLSPCRRRAGGREGGREGGMKGGGCWRCRRGGTYLPPGRGERGAARRLHPAAPGGSCRTGTAQMEASPRTPTPPAPPGPRGTPAPAGQMCPQLEAAPSRAGAGDGRALPGPGGATPGEGPAGQAGRQQPRERGWTQRASCRGLLGGGEVPGGSRSSRNNHAALWHPWHVCSTWQQVWQPQYKHCPCRSLSGLQAPPRAFKKQHSHTFHRHKGERKKCISRF